MARSPTTAVLVAGALVIACCGGRDPSPAAPPPKPIATDSRACERYAAPSGSDRGSGTRAHPFRSVQRLANALAGGGRGCLLPGVYRDYVRVRHGGSAGRPLVLRGDHATLAGVLWIDRADHVQITGLVVDGSRAAEIPVQIMGDDVLFSRNSVSTSGRQRSCMILGTYDRSGRADRVTVRGSRFDRCGSVGHGNKDHAIYVQNTAGGNIVGNAFTGAAAFAVHLYPNAQHMRIAHNLMQGNGGGVMIAGDDRYTSSHNVVEQNVITGSTRFHGVQSSWGSDVGTGNLVRGNCLWGGVGGALGATDGFVARDNAVGPPSARCRQLTSAAAGAGAHGLALSSSDS